MFLISLVISSSLNNEIIRTIKFNKHGLSLIVDETNNENSGSNIGKTTTVKIIDLCLGANSISSIYKEGDTGENHIVKDFIEKQKVVAELTTSINNKIFTFKRALYRNGRNEINGDIIKNVSEYREKLNSIIFNNTNNKPTLRQLIAKFIRLDNSNENSLLKYLGTFTKIYEYQAIYSYLYGLSTSKSQNVDIISLNERIEKDIEVIYRKNGVSTIEEFETKIGLMKEELEKFKKAYKEVTVLKDYESKKNDMDRFLTKIKSVEANLAREKLKVSVMEEKIEREKEKIFTVDKRILQNLYEETRGSVSGPIKDFEELQEFHNGMVTKRLEMLELSLEEKRASLLMSEKELAKLRNDYQANYISFNEVLKDKFEEKYNEFSRNKIKLENAENDYDYIKNMQEEKEINLQGKVDETNNQEDVENIKETLNMYFKKYTEDIVREPYALVFRESDDEFPVRIIGMNGKPGTGVKKAMITCFDLAHISLIIEKNYHMPRFEIHDKMENIDLVELRNIVEVARDFRGQYIFPILNDRIDSLGIQEEEIVLRLSSSDKLFHI